jgi:hypothetical protein
LKGSNPKIYQTAARKLNSKELCQFNKWFMVTFTFIFRETWSSSESGQTSS